MKKKNSTIKRERIDRRIDDGDDGNTISSNFQNSVSFRHWFSDDFLFLQYGYTNFLSSDLILFFKSDVNDIFVYWL